MDKQEPRVVAVDRMDPFTAFRVWFNVKVPLRGMSTPHARDLEFDSHLPPDAQYYWFVVDDKADELGAYLWGLKLIEAQKETTNEEG